MLSFRDRAINRSGAALRHGRNQILCRTDLRTAVLEATFDAEPDLEVGAAVLPSKHRENLIFRSKHLIKQIFGNKTFFVWESSETRFRKVSRRSEPCSRGKRPFEVSKKKIETCELTFEKGPRTIMTRDLLIEVGGGAPKNYDPDPNN